MPQEHHQSLEEFIEWAADGQNADFCNNLVGFLRERPNAFVTIKEIAREFNWQFEGYAVAVSILCCPLRFLPYIVIKKDDDIEFEAYKYSTDVQITDRELDFCTEEYGEQIDWVINYFENINPDELMEDLERQYRKIREEVGFFPVISRKKSNNKEQIVANVEAGVVDLMTKVKEKRGITKKKIVSDAINDWMSGKFDLSDVEWEDEEAKQISAWIDSGLKTRFDEKVSNMGGVKNIIMSLVLKKWITLNYPKLVGNATSRSDIEREG